MGEKVLHGLFVGYVQHSGGGWSGDVYVVDWEEIDEAELRSDVHTKRFKADECKPVLVNGIFQFPLAQGDLKQPGMSERKVRHRNIKKKRIDERKEEEEEQISQQSDAGGKTQPEQARDLIPDLPTAEADFWTCNSNVLIRHHRTPRTKLYVPTEEESPIPFKFIDILRKTATDSEHLRESEFHDI